MTTTVARRLTISISPYAIRAPSTQERIVSLQAATVECSPCLRRLGVKNKPRLRLGHVLSPVKAIVQYPKSSAHLAAGWAQELISIRQPMAQNLENLKQTKFIYVSVGDPPRTLYLFYGQAMLSIGMHTNISHIKTTRPTKADNPSQPSCRVVVLEASPKLDDEGIFLR